MKLKVIMDSGKEYEIETPYSEQHFINSLYNEITNPVSKSVTQIMKNSFMYLDEERKILFNPTHISSVEIID